MNGVATPGLDLELFTGHSVDLQPGADWQRFSSNYLGANMLLPPGEEYIGLGAFIGQTVTEQLFVEYRDLPNRRTVFDIADRFIDETHRHFRSPVMDEKRALTRRGVVMGNALVEAVHQGYKS